MIVDRWRGVFFVEMSAEEKELIICALREHAANLGGFLGRMRNAEAVAWLENGVKQYRDLADCLEGK